MMLIEKRRLKVRAKLASVEWRRCCDLVSRWSVEICDTQITKLQATNFLCGSIFGGDICCYFYGIFESEGKDYLVLIQIDIFEIYEDNLGDKLLYKRPT